MSLGGGAGLVFFGGFLPMFLLYFLAVRSRKCLKQILFMSGLVFFWGRSLFLRFFADVVCVFVCFSFLRDKAQVVTGHPLARACFACSLFSFCVPPLLSVSPVLAVRPASWWVFSGCHSGPRAFLGFSLDLLRPFFWDARRQGFSCASLALCFFSPFVLRLHFF